MPVAPSVQQKKRSSVVPALPAVTSTTESESVMHPFRLSRKPVPSLVIGTSDFASSFQGTAIPPPPQAVQPPSRSQLTREFTPPRTPSLSRTPSSLNPSRRTSLAGFGGPLSSHPITPVESETTIDTIPPHDSGPKMTQPQTDGSTECATTNGTFQPPASADSADSNNFDPSIPQQPAKDTSRRPSFVARFMRLRSSSSFMRSKSALGKFSDSSTSLSTGVVQDGPYTGGSAAPSFVAGSERGVKRSGSPMVGGGAAGPGGSHTFPRMMRKKSMELLTTARRKSGMFGRSDDMAQSAMVEERAREEAREEYMKGFERPAEEDGQSTEEEEKRLEEQRRIETAQRLEEIRKRSPPPTVQLNGQLDGLSSLDGEDMFKNIGRW